MQYRGADGTGRRDGEPRLQARAPGGSSVTGRYAKTPSDKLGAQQAPPQPTRPPVRGKRKIVVKPRFFVFLAVFLMLITGVIWGISAGISALMANDAEILYGMIEDTTSINALIIRDEISVRAESYGTIDYLVPDKTVVPIDTPVVDVYQAGYSSEMIQELKNLRQKIQVEQNEKLRGGIIDATLDEYDASVKQAVENIALQTTLDTTKVASLEKSLRELMLARQDYIKKTTAAKENPSLSQSYAAEAQLVSRIDAWKTTFKAPKEGIVSYGFDGLEPYLTLDTLEALDVTVFQQLQKEENPAVPDELRSQQPLFRLVNPSLWYVAFVTKPSTWKIGVGEVCAISFESMQDVTYNATVSVINGTGDDLVVVLRMTEDVSPLVGVRKMNAVIGGRVEGMMVPLSSLRSDGSEQGVYLSDTQVFVPVRVVGQDAKYALIMPIEEGALTAGMRVKK